MSSEARGRISWRRMLVEGFVIVFSILLAFSVDAWWDGHTERERETALLRNMLAEFRASRPDLVQRLDGARRMARGNAALTRLVASGIGRPAVEVPDSLILAVIGGPTYEPETNALDGAVASGQIEIIRSDTIQAELATWRRIIIDTREDEILVRELTADQVVPLLSREVDLSTYYDRLLSWFFGETAGEAMGAARVAGSTELAGALAQRGFYTQFSADDLAGMLESLDRLVPLIEAELGPDAQSIRVR